ncbi:unnamed protein product [Arabidopsis thaliana]|uniref:Uncharacterized protein n=2 Tax=Arabidopsis thaliana TaxID=3702 RepID=A0A654EPX9_ARATH|nr:uncharacterized protein AT1G72545 [Arabidopsis thaliana]ANM58676.1 hypothetical protein AT1G72545 [Arabidopsis thaliana]CAA0331345.1 unnamed protein product [Arabidopsis thaliana]VYS50818.1 unnamed protein product [Arabidopsis thaliana]|eukprot:NP_001321092.1 hypothetical protein AT1G72545 [Arabidopsis thaliana]
MEMQNRHRSIRITELKRMLEGLKSLNSRPFAAPRRIFTLVNQGKAPPYSALHQTVLILWRRNHYQPLSMALSTFSFQSLNSNRLIFQTSLEAIINETFVDFPETSFTEEIIL